MQVVPQLHLSPRAGRGRISSEAKRSDGIRVRGPRRQSELEGSPPHPTCFASLTLCSQVDLSPHAGRGGRSGTASSLLRLEPQMDILLLRVAQHLLETFLAADAGLLVAAERCAQE